MSNYRRGADFENAVKKDFESNGWVAVRAAGSHTPADVYCIKPGRVVFVQCKRDGVLRPQEWNEFLDYSRGAGAVPLVAFKATRGIAYRVIKDYKDGSKKSQPWEEWKQ